MVSFDVLQDPRGTELLDQPLQVRRRRLERLLAGAPPELPICPQTTDERTAGVWFTKWASAGVEGVVVKRLTGRYRPGKVGRPCLRGTHPRLNAFGTVAAPGMAWHPSRAAAPRT